MGLLFTCLIGLLAGYESSAARFSTATLALLLAARALDIAVYQMGSLLNDEQSPLQSSGWSFLLALVNLAELGVITAGWLMALGLPRAQSVLEGARVSTFQNDLAVEGGWSNVLVAGTMAVAVLVAVGSVGLAIGKIAETFHRA